MMKKGLDKKILAIALKIAEGKRREIIDQIARDIEHRTDHFLLDLRQRQDSDFTVIKYAGPVETVMENLPDVCGSVLGRIDYSAIENSDQTVGSLSSVVLIPVRNLSKPACQKLVMDFAAGFSEQYSHPLFLFGKEWIEKPPDFSQKIQSLELGELHEKIKSGELRPDFGPNRLNPENGITLIGMRDYVVTLLLYLDTEDIFIAQEIADDLGRQGRIIYNEKGEPVKNKKGEVLRQKGRFPNVDTLAIDFTERKMSQVACNIKNYRKPTIVELYRAAVDIAGHSLIDILGSSLIGFIPLSALETAARKLPDAERIQNQSVEKKVEAVVKYLSLDLVEKFDPQWQILDYRLSSHL